MKHLFLPLLTLSSTLMCMHPQAGFCIVPVADLYSERIVPPKGQSLEKAAQDIPLSQEQLLTTCIRATQLLFNERVTILQKEKGLVYVETEFWHLINNFFIKTDVKNNRFWTLDQNIQPITTCCSDIQKSIPQSRLSDQKPPTAVLKKSWNCPKTNVTYSAGTRFVIEKKDEKTCSVLVYDPTKKTVVTLALPNTHVIVEKERSNEEKRVLFVSCVTEWATHYHPAIPYVLGGASIVFPASANGEYPYTGVDCSGLIRLGCTVADIPLFATNSRSIASVLKKLPDNVQPQPGDLLYWKGHIAVIADTKHLIEARGYDHHYGTLHKLSYQKEFKGIKNLTDIITAYTKKTPLSRIDKLGKQRQTITDFTVLQLLD